MMVTDGSRVCCVDEVSSGLDPLSRRKIWDILVAELFRRGRLPVESVKADQDASSHVDVSEQALDAPSVSAGRAVLLTTHSIEEAQAVAGRGRVGVVSGGLLGTGSVGHTMDEVFVAVVKAHGVEEG